MDYNDAFLNLMAAVEQKNINGIRQHTQKSLECARSLKQPDLEIGVLFMAATGFLEVKQLPTALKVYDEATKIAKDAELKETNKDLYQRLGAQIMLCKSSALFTQTPPQYNMAIEAYQQTADKCQEIITNKMNKGPIEWTNGGILYLYLFESLRILGYCQEQLGRHHAAFKPYVKAVNAAEEMNEDIRKNVALKSVGISLLQLCRKLGKKNEYFVVIDKINGLLGVGWEKDVSKPKTIK